MENIQDKLKEYAELKNSQKFMEQRLKELSPDILSFLKGQSIDKLPTNLGTFSIGSKSIWKFSKAVEELQDKEKAKGIAKQIITSHVRFTAPKESDEK